MKTCTHGVGSLVDQTKYPQKHSHNRNVRAKQLTLQNTIMSQRECPTCRYTFLKKKDYLDHVTYSSCAEKLHDLLVVCPHCSKQFPDEDSLSYHMMHNEVCFTKQDKAIDFSTDFQTV
jgi:uncharacterized C2H2 Zn-finger protein